MIPVAYKKKIPPWRRSTAKFAEHIAFDSFIMSIICIDAIFFGLEWSGSVTDAIGGSITFFIESAVVCGVFVLEVILKFVAYTPIGYFRSKWNILDFFITALSIAALAVEAALQSRSGASAIVFFRFLRLLRFIRVVNKVRAIAIKSSSLDVRLPAARCIETLQKLRKQLGDQIPKKKKDDKDTSVTQQDLMFIIDQIRDKTLYRLVLGAEDMGDEEMHAYLSSTVNIIVDEQNNNNTNNSSTRKRNSEEMRRNSVNMNGDLMIKEQVILSDVEKMSFASILPDFNGTIDTDALNRLVATLTSWDFDVFKTAELTQGHELVFIAYFTMERFDLFAKMHIPVKKFLNFVTRIESGYKANPYHNKTHAADVLQGSFAMLTTGNIGEFLSDLEIFAVLLSSIVHDFEHPGVTNVYLANTDDTLALRYNDKAILEMHHVAATFALIQTDPTMNILAELSRDDYCALRKYMIDIVLGTEMAAHFEVLEMFRTKCGDGIEMKTKEERTLVMKMLVHVADISNPTRNSYLAGRWTDNVMNEFFLQGDKERDKGLKISPFMDRHTSSIPKCQIGFIDFIVAPLHGAWAEFLKSKFNANASSEELAASLLSNIQANRNGWNIKKEAEEAAAAAAAVIVNANGNGNSSSTPTGGTPGGNDARRGSSRKESLKSSNGESRRGSGTKPETSS